MNQPIDLGKHTVDKQDLSGSFLLFALLESEDCKAHYFLVPFELEFDLCKILASINGLIVNYNQDNFDPNCVDWFCEFNDIFWDYLKDDTTELIKVLNEKYPLLKYYLSEPYVHFCTINFISTASFAP